MKYLRRIIKDRLNIIEILLHKSWRLTIGTLINLNIVRSTIDYSLFSFNILSDTEKKNSYLCRMLLLEQCSKKDMMLKHSHNMHVLIILTTELANLIVCIQSAQLNSNQLICYLIEDCIQSWNGQLTSN